MKNIFCLLALLFALGDVRGQNDERSQTFIKAVIGDFVKQNQTKKIIYSDKVYSVNDIRKALDHDTLPNIHFVKRPYDTTIIVLTRDERAYINSELDQMMSRLWTDGLLDNSKMIPQDTIDAIFKDRTKRWEYFYNKYGGGGFYSFSRPIFIRNNSICFFYREYSCGDLCASGELALYVNKKGKWVKLKVLYSMIS